MTPDMVQRHAAPVPRYTSYPTAPNFSAAIGPVRYLEWLAALPPRARLSLYLHVPFCREMCWYCGCTTKAVRRYEPIAAYLATLGTEIAAVSRLLPRSGRVAQVHLGGGSPSILSAADIRRLGALLNERFDVAEDAEIAVEIDPRELPHESVRAFAAAGVNRVSIGVQDFDPAVQAAINREQSYETTRAAVEGFRAEGVGSINIDLVYGLPHQTVASVTRTIEQILTLKPERIAVFGYAHVPKRASHQKMIAADALPGHNERYRQSRRIAELVTGAGYRQLGIDHFALPGDELARRPLRRNFQGYTTDDCDAIIGLGASSIGRLPQGYVQNAVPVADWAALVARHGVATVRGFELSADDRMRGHVIERLMCDFTFSRTELSARFGAAADQIIAEAEALVADDRDGFVERTGDGFRCTEAGRVFVRKICARFDAYWGGSANHALAV